MSGSKYEIHESQSRNRNIKYAIKDGLDVYYCIDDIYFWLFEIDCIDIGDDVFDNKYHKEIEYIKHEWERGEDSCFYYDGEYYYTIFPFLLRFMFELLRCENECDYETDIYESILDLLFGPLCSIGETVPRPIFDKLHTMCEQNKQLNVIENIEKLYKWKD